MHPPCRPILHPLTQPLPRSFTTTTHPLARPSRTALAHRHRDTPAYPHGPSLLYKQSNFGLYGNVKPQYGNKVSERNEIKTRRKWEPNIHDKRLWSVALNKYMRVKVQARVLRTIDKVGGLDEYLLGERPARIRELGMEGWKMRWRLLQDRGVKERLMRRRAELGLPPMGPEIFLSDAELLREKEVRGDELGKESETPYEMDGEGEEGSGGEVTEEKMDRLLVEDRGEKQRQSGTIGEGEEGDGREVTKEKIDRLLENDRGKKQRQSGIVGEGEEGDGRKVTEEKMDRLLEEDGGEKQRQSGTIEEGEGSGERSRVNS
ncbi:MAG: hypothetical protein Q9166_006461 [cf. Caloplaca sp. 2 TL-2023]